MTGPVDASKHGKRCKCPECKGLRNAKHREWTARRRSLAAVDPATIAAHGTAWSYELGCRCSDCREWQVSKYQAHARQENLRSQGRHQRVQQVTLENPRLRSHARRKLPWTGPELELAARSDLTSLQVALMIGRTETAVHVMRGRLRKEPLLDKIAGMGRGAS